MIWLELSVMLVCFITVFLVTPWLIKYLKNLGLMVKDQNKKNKPLVPLSGGLAVLAGVIVSIFLYIFLKMFVVKSAWLDMDTGVMAQILVGLLTITIITILGFLDDIVIDRKKNESIGFRQWQRPLLSLIAAIPLVAISAGVHSMNFPFIGMVHLGWIYPLILIPIGVMGAANMVNLLAGMNGLETGMGIVYTSMLGLYAFVHGSYVAALISLIVFVGLLAFIIYNKVPAKILPGDSLTYLLGGTIAVVAILGNIERAALIASIPFFIEFALKTRSKYQAKSYGFEKNGKIHNIHGQKIYSLVHLFSRTGKFTERQIVWSLVAIELVFCCLMWVV